MSMTTEQIETLERFDVSIYTSNKALFETLLRQTLSSRNVATRNANTRAMLDGYNKMADNCMANVQRCRRLENGIHE